MKSARFAAVLTAASVLAATPALAQETWDMPMAYADSNFHTQTGKEFARAVDVATDGRIKIVVHASGSLFKGGDIKRAIQTGQAPIGERLLSGHQNEEILFGFDSIPFLATSFEASAKLWAAARPEIETVLDRQNLKLLYACPWPPQGIYTKKPLAAASDMQGVKFRSYNSATARMAELMGALPVQVEAAELSQALATGVAESFISSGATGYDRKVWEHLTHFYEVDAWLPRNYVMVNKGVWTGLDEATRKAIVGVAAVSEYACNWRSKHYTDFTLNGLRTNGMTVARAEGRLRGDFEKIGEVMTAEWLEKAGAPGKAIVDAFKAM